MQRSLLLAQLVVVSVLAAIHLAALSYDLYWIFPWLDLVTHFLGGAWSALVLYWAGALFSRAPGVFLLVAGVLVLGVAWELFELFFGISAAADYPRDTFTDLLMDVIGAACATVMVKRLFTHAQN